MADDEDWLPGADIQAARKELRDVKAWLATVQQKNRVPASPRAKTPTVHESTEAPKSPRGEVDVGGEGDEAREEVATDKATSPPRSAKKRASKVSEADQVEHNLAGGQWEGLGAVRKGGEIRIEVRLRWLASRVTDAMHRADSYSRRQSARPVAKATRCARGSRA